MRNKQHLKELSSITYDLALNMATTFFFPLLKSLMMCHSPTNIHKPTYMYNVHVLKIELTEVTRAQHW